MRSAGLSATPGTLSVSLARALAVLALLVANLATGQSATTGSTIEMETEIETVGIETVVIETVGIETVEELRAAVAAGGAYTLSAANFLLDEPLIVSRDLTLIGAAWEEELATGQGSGSIPAPTSVIRVRWAEAGIIVTEGATVRVEGIHFDGVVSGTIRSDGTRDSGDGLDLIRVLDGRLEVVRSALTRARLGPVEDGRRYGRGSGLFVTGSSVVTVVDSVFGDNRLAALEATDDATVEVLGTMFVGNLNGVFVEGNGRLQLHGSTIRDHPASGLILRGAATALVADTTLSNNGASPDSGRTGSDGVRIGDTARVTLRDNTFVDSPRYVISLYGEANVISENNLFANNGGYIEADGFDRAALLVEDDAVMLSAGDAFVDNPGGGIEVFGNGRLELRGVEIRGNGSIASVYLGDQAVTIMIDAAVSGNLGSITAVDSSRLTIQGGTYATTRTDGIYVAGFSTLTLGGAEIRDNQGFAISVSDDARVEVDLAMVTSNRAGGVVFYDRGSGRVTNTRFLDNRAGQAMLYRIGADVHVEGNQLE